MSDPARHYHAWGIEHRHGDREGWMVRFLVRRRRGFSFRRLYESGRLGWFNAGRPGGAFCNEPFISRRRRRYVVVTWYGGLDI